MTPLPLPSAPTPANDSRRPSPAVSYANIQAAQVQLDNAGANLANDALAIDYVKRAIAILLQEYRLARRTVRIRRKR